MIFTQVTSVWLCFFPSYSSRIFLMLLAGNAVVIGFLTLISLISLNSGLIFAHALISVFWYRLNVVAAGFTKGVEEGKKEVYPYGGMPAMAFLHIICFEKTVCSPSDTTILFSYFWCQIMYPVCKSIFLI